MFLSVTASSLVLIRLYDWSVDWQMRFNIDKCKTLHFGYANARTEYLLGDEVLTTDEKEKDLGRYHSSDAKV